jgi:hypothetical protein
MDRRYSEAQLSKFRRLIRVAVRWLFSGDLSERIQEQTVRQAFDQTKRKRKQASAFTPRSGVRKNTYDTYDTLTLSQAMASHCVRGGLLCMRVRVCEPHPSSHGLASIVSS